MEEKVNQQLPIAPTLQFEMKQGKPEQTKIRCSSPRGCKSSKMGMTENRRNVKAADNLQILYQLRTEKHSFNL